MEYIVGHYRYAGDRLRVACVRKHNIDFLPPVMYSSCMVTNIVAYNKKEAIKIWRQMEGKHSHK